MWKRKKTYCLICWKKADNKKIRAVALVNKTATQRSLCTGCNSRKSTFLKPITNKKQILIMHIQKTIHAVK